MRNYHIIVGSKGYYDSAIKTINTRGKIGYFMELVKLSDSLRQQGKLLKEERDVLFVKNNDYHGIVEAAHDRLGALIEEFTKNNADIYIHNPPRVLLEYLRDQERRKVIQLDVKTENYDIQRKPEIFVDNINWINSAIKGQKAAVNEISKSLWYLTTVSREKPYVIMLYGNSSLGKTELVREIADKFFNGKFLEKHLSMFKNNSYSDYFFGEAPNRRSIGFELLERESNLVFFDEIDKCPEYFYSAFYTLLDNTLFKDATYDVDISGIIIVLTSNFHTTAEMKEHLGLPIYYRINKFIHFDDFDADTIYSITRNEIELRKNEFINKFTVEQVYCAVSSHIKTSGENARTIKHKVQQVIEDLLFQDVMEGICK